MHGKTNLTLVRDPEPVRPTSSSGSRTRSVPHFRIILFHIRRAKSSSRFTKDLLRRPSNAMHTYRCLQVLELSVNCLIRTYFFFVVNNSVVTIVVVSIFTLVRLSKHESIVSISILSILSVFCTVYLIIVHIIFGQFNEVSKVFVGSWKRNTSLNYYDRKAVLKYIRSCRLLRIEIGTFGHFKKATCLHIVGKLIFYTVKLLMVTSQHFDSISTNTSG